MIHTFAFLPLLPNTKILMMKVESPIVQDGKEKFDNQISEFIPFDNKPKT